MGERGLTSSSEYVEYRETRLVFKKRLTHEVAETMAQTLTLFSEANRWWIGDFLNMIEDEWGELYAQYIPESWAKGTAMTCKRVCKAIPPNARRREISFSHHVEVAGLDPVTRDRWLERAILDNMSVRDLRIHVKPKKGPGDKQLLCACPYLNQAEVFCNQMEMVNGQWVCSGYGADLVSTGAEAKALSLDGGFDPLPAPPIEGEKHEIR